MQQVSFNATMGALTTFITFVIILTSLPYPIFIYFGLLSVNHLKGSHYETYQAPIDEGF